MSTEAHNAETEETEATQVDKVNTGALGTLVTVGLFAMISICAAVTALVRHDMDAEQAEKDADGNQTVVALKAEQRGVLNGSPAYINRGKGIVSLPIETAKQIVVAELERDPSSATPPQAADAGVAAAATSASGAPSEAGSPPAADSAKKPEETGTAADAKKGAGAKPEKVKDPKPAPASSAHPASPPLSPTAASPGAKAPGPLKD
ncbi:MAG TPA: hypothetical protein VNW92_16325 [Polyangiaceae bacterium]|jgi:hypothetical protein|nr:hypothetical protein [Polyangiaceae bacterium]